MNRRPTLPTLRAWLLLMLAAVITPACANFDDFSVGTDAQMPDGGRDGTTNCWGAQAARAAASRGQVWREAI